MDFNRSGSIWIEILESTYRASTIHNFITNIPTSSSLGIYFQGVHRLLTGSSAQVCWALHVEDVQEAVTRPAIAIGIWDLKSNILLVCIQYIQYIHGLPTKTYTKIYELLQE